MTVRKLRKDWLVSREQFEAQRSNYFVRHGTMRMTLHKPILPNVQTPHEQDELYLIQCGCGRFTKSGETRAFGPGDAIFVEAGAEHRFDEISEDTLLWILFWGPPGGETETECP
jgi:mannose-6-phosphate isomerase-like protein (cupin superfamily)